MLKRIMLIASLLFVGEAIAKSYFVEVTVNAVLDQNLLSITNHTAMSFPELTISEHTTEGAHCVANSHYNSNGFDGNPASNYNSLCPTLKGTYSRFNLSGHPYAYYYVSYSAPEQVINGLQYTVPDFKPTTVKLSSGGTAIYYIPGTVTLVDKSAVTSDIITFEYDFTAYYQ